MRYRVKDYSFYFPAGDVQLIIIDQADLTIEDIRLIVNETKNKVICSSMQKGNVLVSNTQDNRTSISVPKSVCVLSSTDQLTIEIDRGEAPAAGGDATKENQERMLMALNVADQIPELVAMTDEEILKAYDGYDSEGQHIEGIADQTYGHLVPAQVTIDDEPFTFYQERTYSDYGYSVLYKNGVAIDTTTTHPQEDDELTTTI